MAIAACCDECGAEIPVGAPEGHCTTCLFQLGLQAHESSAGPDTTDLAPILAKTHSGLGVKFHRLGDYDLIEEIARGGMGVVFRARQVSLNRPVALKLILGGRLASPALIKRFQVEAESAASLRHPNIVTIHEIGERDGQHFYSMELIDGTGLDRALARFQLPRPDGSDSEVRSAIRHRQSAIARLLATVARAVDFAHQRGVLHRDLKPANILIDREGQPHLADFGLAKLMDEERTQVTLSGAVLGTPNYMAPELASGHANQATTGTDIYSLGAILYELLIGEPPFQAQTPLEIWRGALEEEAKNPSVVNRFVDRDLATVCLKCLEKEPQRRYESARALAEDLERWLNGQPIAARRVSASERLWRWCRRKPALAGLSAAAVISLVAGIIGVSTQWRRAERAARINRVNLYAADVGLAQQALKENNIGRARQLLDAYRPLPGEEDLRGFEWRLLRHSAQGDHTFAFFAHSNVLRSVAFSSDSNWLATAGADGSVKLWDFNQRRLSQILTGHTGGVNCVAFSPDARLMATTGQEGTLKLWDTTSWQVTTQLTCRPYWVAFSPTEPLLAYSEGGAVNVAAGRVRLWNYATDGRVKTWADAGSRFAFSPDGKILITGNADRLVLRDTATGSNLWTYPRPFAALSIAVSSDGAKFAACSFQGEVRVFDLANPDQSVALKGHTGRPRGVAFSPNGTYLAAASGEQSVRVWYVSSWDKMNALPRALSGHGSGVRCLAFSPDGQFLASGDRDGMVLLWHAKTRLPAAMVTNVFAGYTSAPPVFSRDSELIAGLSAPHEVGVWDLRTQERVQTFSGAMIPLALSDDHQTFIAMSSNYTYQVWDVKSGQLRDAAQFVRPEKAFTAKLSADGKILAVGYVDGSFTLWNTATRKELWQHRGHTNNIREFAFSPDGRLLATASHDLTAKLWDLGTRKEISTLSGHSDEVWAVAFSPGGATLATGSIDHTVRLWAVPRGKLLAVLAGHKEGVIRAAFTPDGRTLATASDDDTVRLWHLATRREVARLDHGFNVMTVGFIPNGEMLVSSSARKAIHFFRAPSFSALDDADRKKTVRD